MERLLEEMISMAERIISPAAVTADLALKEVTEREIRFEESPIFFSSRRLAQHLEGCYKATLMVCTIGQGLDEACERLINDGETTRAYLLDAIGSETVEALAEKLEGMVAQRAASLSSPIRSRFSPGYGDWPLSEQALLFSLLEPDRIGVSLTETFIMVPRKSISAIIGWQRPKA
jgi:cobalamin-dependent methionine synthase I